MSATSPLWAPQNYKYTENKIEGTKKSHATSARRSEQGPVKHTQQNVCVCVLWEVVGRAPFEGGTWNNVVIEIITVHTKNVRW